MRIRVNGEEREAIAGLTLAELLRELGLEAKGAAVERNREIVPKSRYADVVLNDGDDLEIVQFVGGGR